MSTGQAPARRLRVVDEQRQRHLDENDTRTDVTRATLRPLQEVSAPPHSASAPAVVDARVAKARQRAGEIIAKYTISRTDTLNDILPRMLDDDRIEFLQSMGAGTTPARPASVDAPPAPPALRSVPVESESAVAQPKRMSTTTR